MILFTGGLVPSPGGCLVAGGLWSRGRGAWSGGVPAAGGTHPTGMHSCYHYGSKIHL